MGPRERAERSSSLSRRGELLLTTGLALRDEQPAGPYVRRLVDAGVAALGFGAGLGNDAVVPEIVQAAEEAGLPLLEVPRRTPFIAISRAVSAALAADEYAAVARTASVQQDLTRAALAPGGTAPLVERLARSIDGWVLLLDPVGTALDASPARVARRAGSLQSELDRLRGMRAPASAALSGPEETVLIQSLGTSTRTRRFLVVGRPGTLPPSERHVVNAAALLLTLRMEQSRGLDSAMAALRAALLRLLLAGEDRTVATVVDELGQQLPAEPLLVLAVLGSSEQRAARRGRGRRGRRRGAHPGADVLRRARRHPRPAHFCRHAARLGVGRATGPGPRGGGRSLPTGALVRVGRWRTPGAASGRARPRPVGRRRVLR
jgi:PucR family transcriptional regulator, purine catabolism regulatory protein